MMICRRLGRARLAARRRQLLALDPHAVSLAAYAAPARPRRAAAPAGRPGRDDLVERLEQLVVRSHVDGRAAEAARDPGDVDRAEGRPGAVAAVVARERVHDRVARRWPSRSAGRRPRSARRSTAPGSRTSRSRRRSRRRRAGRGRPIRRPIEPADPEAEAAVGAADEPERRAGGDPLVELGPARGRLLDQHRVARQPLGQRGEHVAARSGSPGAGGGGRAAAGAAAPAVRRSRWASCSASAAQAAPPAPPRASSHGLRWASAGSSVITATRVPGATSGPGSSSR